MAELFPKQKKENKMKKLIIAAAVACVAALTQAASVSWSITGLKGSDGNTLTSGAAYVFCTKGTSATTVAAVTSAIDGLNAGDLKTYLTDNSISALKGTISGGGASVSGVDLATSGVPEKQSGTAIFAVIVDDDTFGDGVKYVVTGVSGNVKTPAASTTNVATFSLDGAAATANASNWTAAAPEPTSGLLLLLGVAGLALKRKRA